MPLPLLEQSFPNTWELPTFSQTILSSKKSEFAVVIPVLNEGERLLKILTDLKKLVPRYDVILADGKSSDGSTEPARLTELGVTQILVTEERGLGTALRMGLAAGLRSGYAGLITVDGNGKDDVSALPLFIEKLSSGFDFVQGSRFAKGGGHKNTPLVRHLALKILLIPILNLKSPFRFTDPSNGFKGLSRHFLLSKKVQPFRNVFAAFNLQLYLNRVAAESFRCSEVPTVRNYPSDGTVPTKIIGLKVLWRLFKELIFTVRGNYHPRARVFVMENHPPRSPCLPQAHAGFDTDEIKIS